ncbi:hypothetical protein GCK72_026252 [Caenorhabditis remanei]|uniref:Uncharacterized protein n=1 Tax=Caenorhabditis remanei TaxID=31234 RepID=A0A6A5G4Q1_CAERE|nr:hypothetical protein GCK72_026252 [Caenorhabditis remanei]KAF1749783.1 hypothetical protein GCK72_026252 [Caenorhabditis remanei]
MPSEATFGEYIREILRGNQWNGEVLHQLDEVITDLWPLSVNYPIPNELRELIEITIGTLQMIAADAEAFNDWRMVVYDLGQELFEAFESNILDDFPRGVLERAYKALRRLAFVNLE